VYVVGVIEQRVESGGFKAYRIRHDRPVQRSADVPPKPTQPIGILDSADNLLRVHQQDERVVQLRRDHGAAPSIGVTMFEV
jgi:hypothetical protein